MLLGDTGWWMRLSFSCYSCFQESLFSSSLGWVFAFGTFPYWGFHFLIDLYGLFIHKTIIYFFAKSTFNRLLYPFLCVCAYECVWMCVESVYMHKYSCMKREARKSTLWVLPQESCALLDTNPAWSWDLLVENTLLNVFIAFLAQNMQLAFHFSYRFPSVGIMGFWNSQDALEEHRSIFLFSTPSFPCLGCCSQNLRWRHVHYLSFYLGPYFSLCGGGNWNSVRHLPLQLRRETVTNFKKKSR